MRTNLGYPASRVTEPLASSGFVPPSWSDLSPLLSLSALMWITIFVLALIRSTLHAYFHSQNFRTFVRHAKRTHRARSPLIRFAKAFRNFRMMLVRNKFPETVIAQYFGLPRFIAGVVVCLLYIIDTYIQGIPTHCYIFQLIYGIAVTVNLFFAFLYAERPILFAVKLKTVVECLSIPGLLFASGKRWLNFNFLQAYCILVEWALLEKHDIVLRNNSTLTRLLINLTLQLITFAFITSCGVQFFELLGDPGQALRSETFQITWANSVYFAVVTLMTVGYGDFVPYTLLGRVWIILHIIFAAYLVSREISLLIDALNSMRRGGGSYVNSSGTEHVVVTGRVKWEFLQQFIKEFLAETSNLDTRVIVLTSNPNWSDDDWLRFVGHNPFYDHHLMFLDGSPLKMDDLDRAQAAAARGIFVLADPHRRDPYKEDSDILKAVLTIRNYSGSVPIYTLNTLQESSFQFGIAMEHLEPVQPTDLLLGASSNLAQSKTFLGIPQMQLSQGNEFSRIDTTDDYVPEPQGRYGGTTSPVLRSGEDFYRMESGSVLDAQAHNLYSREEDYGIPSSTADASIQNAPTNLIASNKLRRAGKVRKSESLCMQELETVLLAENVFCNGLSTLLANATLRVAPQSHRNDRPWLVEYKLGAECSIQQFKIPEELNGFKFGAISTILQDYGLVLLAMRLRTSKDWTLLSVDTSLKADLDCMALSYHNHSVIDKIADHAAKYIKQQEGLKQKNAQNTGNASNSGVAGSVHSLEADIGVPHREFAPFEDDSGAESDDGLGRHDTRLVLVSGGRNESRVPGADQKRYLAMDSSGGEGRNSNDLEQHSLIGRLTSKPSSRPRKVSSKMRSVDGFSLTARDSPDGEIGKHIYEGKRVKGSPSSAGGRSSKNHGAIYSNMDKLPAALRGHVIVCLDGESPLLSFDVLLRRIWMVRLKQKKRVPVVVIHPSFPKDYSRQLGGDQKDLFLLQGNSLSLETLKQAQYQNARAFLIMASESCEPNGKGSTDSKTIFTVMTLDSLLADQETFVCCVLDAEESLQLLRAPRQARRVGVNLGIQREPDVFNYERSPLAGLPKRTTSAASLLRNVPSSPFLTSYGNLAPNMGSIPVFSGQGSNYPVRRSDKGIRLRMKGMTRSTSMRLDQDESSDDDDEEQPGTDVHNLRDEHHSQQLSREELYERQRYASGEMMISSLFTALLAREYTDPGYIRLIRQLIGASSGSKGSWIRQVPIPPSWTRNENAIEGRTYRETSDQLLKMGCVALGLYRSGDAPVRVETKSEQWQRRVDEIVYLDETEISLLRNEAESRSIASRFISNDTTNPERRSGESQPEFNLGNNAQRSESFSRPDLSASHVSFGELPYTFGEQDDEFDQLYYTCPSTKRRIYYEEAENGENVLPYVYCCPEPYSLVASGDAVFVLCHPSKEIPMLWHKV